MNAQTARHGLLTPFRTRLLAAALALASAACGAEPQGSVSPADLVPEEERYGGTVVMGGIGDLSGMNGLVSSDYTGNNIQRHMLFMTTVAYDEDLNVIPYLAQWDTVRVEGDSLELTFRVRDDVTWHDGTPTTARDVLFTYLRAIEPTTAFPNMSNFDLYSRHAELVDDHTFKVRLRPHSEFLDIWVQTPIMPEHVLGDVPPGELLQHPFRNEPVGNGPFRFVRRVPGQEWVFDANPDFPEALGGRPYLDRIVYRAIPEPTTLLTELLTGNVDVYLAPEPSMVPQIEATDGVELRSWLFRAWDYIAWNTRLPQFSDARVRRALTMALNRQQMVDALREGYGSIGRGTVPPTHWAYEGDDPETLLPYDTAQARALLTEAGWTPGPDGILRNAEGTEFRFELMTNAGNATREDVVEIVQAQLRPLGIVVEPRLIEFTSMISTLQGSLDDEGERVRDFDAVVGGWVIYIRQDDADLLHCRNLHAPYQYVGYCNPRMDQLIDTLGVILDREEAMPLWREYQRLFVQESPYTVLYYLERLAGVNQRLQGAVMDIRGETVTANEWWVLRPNAGGS